MSDSHRKREAAKQHSGSLKAANIMPHYLSPASQSKQSNDFLVVGHSGTWQDYDDSLAGKSLADARQYSLEAWYTIDLSNGDTHASTDSLVDRLAQGTLWSVLLSRAATSRHLIVVAEDVWPLISAIGTWRLIDAGILSLTSPRSKKPADGRHVYITYGSPTCVTVWTATSKNKLTFCDYGNWGFKPTGETVPLKQACAIADGIAKLKHATAAIGLSKFELSASGIGYRLWREKHVKPKSILCHRNEAVLDMERIAYYSGRCEAFGTGTIQGTIYRVDVRSAYAHQCTTQMVPIKLVDYSEKAFDVDRPFTLAWHATLADVAIDSDIAFAPVRDSGHVVYPVGKYRTILAGPELEYAVSLGIVKRVYRRAVYAVGPAMKSWAESLLVLLSTLRTNGDSVLSGPIKLAINAGIGRIGARWRRWIPGGDGPPDWRWGQWIFKHPSGVGFTFGRALAGHRYYQDDGLAWPDAVIAIPAWIASAQRVELHRLMSIAGESHVFYTDTDSLWVDSEGYARLWHHCTFHDTLPGSLHIEAIHKTVSIAGQKVYRADGEWTVPSIDVGGWANMFAGEITLRNMGLADSLHRQRPPEGLARKRRVKVRCCSEQRMNGPWEWKKRIRLESGT